MSGAFVETGDVQCGPAKVRLGEEVPSFCERCGGGLGSAEPTRCGVCGLPHLRCPACGERRVVNTLRPAARAMWGRYWALWLGWAVLWRVNFFAWLLVAWGAMGMGWSYERFSSNDQLPPEIAAELEATLEIMRAERREREEIQAAAAGATTMPAMGWTGSFTFIIISRPRGIDLWSIAAFSGFGLAFGLLGRLALLRWRRCRWVGLVLGGLVVAAIAAGARLATDWNFSMSAFTWQFLALMALAGGMVLLGSVLAWRMCAGLARVLLPGRRGEALLGWMRWKVMSDE